MASNFVRGFPVQYGNSARALPPFNIQPRGAGAGTAQTETVPDSLYFVLNCIGPDSTQDLDANIRMHQLEIVRVWFNLPGGATLPATNTLFLEMDCIGQSEINWATTKNRFSPAPTVEFVHNDPTQESEVLHNKTVAVMTLGDVAAGDHVEWENKAKVQHRFAGDSRGVRQIRVSIRAADNTLYTDLNGERIYIEMFVWGERTMQ